MGINNKGQSAALAILTAFMLFMIGMIFINPLKTSIDSSRLGMNCSDSTISDGSKLTCLIIDIVMPYFIISIFSIAGGLVISRFVGGGAVAGQ